MAFSFSRAVGTLPISLCDFGEATREGGPERAGAVRRRTSAGSLPLRAAPVCAAAGAESRHVASSLRPVVLHRAVRNELDKQFGPPLTAYCARHPTCFPA